jgi:3-phenylpropionate/trans-cinnamate dioxygenase ferredoxin reductase subunit
MSPGRVVIVGGGPAAQRCAFKLRRDGYDGRLAVISDDVLPPYDRTMVSKSMLLEPCEPRLLEAEHEYAAAEIDLRLGVRAAGLDAARRRVILETGPEEPYDALVLATGGRALLPPALAVPGVLTLRSAADGRRLAGELLPGQRLAIVGGGFIGGEVASAACARGLEVTLIEALDAPLAGVLGREAGERVALLHESHGVTVLANELVESARAAGRGIELRLAGGRRVTADLVLAGVGMRPAVDWLAGAPCVQGGVVVTDEVCRTSLPNVVAAGDCAAWVHRGYGELLHIQHWDTAARHGAAAALTVLDRAEAFMPLPYFWSDQHGVKFQLVGRADGHDRVELEDLDPPRAFVARYYRDDELRGVLAAGHPRAIGAARRELDFRVPELHQ